MSDPRVAAFRPLRTHVPRALGRTTFARLLVAAIWTNCLAIFLYHLTAGEVFQQVGNVAAVATVTVCTALAAAGQRFAAARPFGLLLVAHLAANWWLNRGHANPIDTVKFFAIFAIFAAARQCGGTLRLPRAVYGLAVLPMVLIALGGSRVGPRESWAFLPNVNTAALYYTALLFVFSLANPRFKLAAQLGVSVLSGKVGVLLASIGAMLLSGAVRLRGPGLLLAIFTLLLAGPLLLSGVLDRQIAVIGNLLSDLYRSGISGIASSSFAELHRTRGSDLSGYFRIIHWAEILAFWGDGGPVAWLFGYGGGHTPAFTTLKLVPHSDYLKVLAEFGLFALLAFVALVATAALGIRDRVQRALFLVVAIYFATENLLTNFASMALVFGFAGLAWRRRG